MFSKAYEIASNFTRPLIISTRLHSGEVHCSIGAFVIINNEGWIVTAAHLMQPILLHQQYLKEVSDYNSQVKSVESDPKLNHKQRKRKLSRLKHNPKWLTNFSYWWGADGIRVDNIEVLPDGDIAVGKLDPFIPDMVSVYPVIKDPQNLLIGTSLCKLGYPFHNAASSFDEKTGNFKLAEGTLPVPRFPIEGIYTRNLLTGTSSDGKYELKFIETSSPGLRGQSGGAVFDINGTVWGIQSRTNHLQLGFSPKVKRDGKEIEENQFLNVGIAVHPEVLYQFLSENNISFELSDY